MEITEQQDEAEIKDQKVYTRIIQFDAPFKPSKPHLSHWQQIDRNPHLLSYPETPAASGRQSPTCHTGRKLIVGEAGHMTIFLTF
jgi:hypothetical protein